MRLKTFLASYALFLFLLFGTIGIISTYLTHSQTTMLKSRSLREYQTISISLANDMATIADRLDGDDFLTAVQDLVAGYSLFYSSHNIRLTLAEGTGSEIEAVFLNPEPGTHLVNVRGPLRSPFENFQLRAYLDLSEPMADMAYIQRMLLDFALIFAVIGAGAFHWILGIIFKPLDTIATASREI
ncbi:MAG: hypothetical protein FWF59_01130, partial [Turicibacter sp.]|nr:hypothetical protein [Turicibacter sp.]